MIKIVDVHECKHQNFLHNLLHEEEKLRSAEQPIAGASTFLSVWYCQFRVRKTLVVGYTSDGETNGGNDLIFDKTLEV